MPLFRLSTKKILCENVSGTTYIQVLFFFNSMSNLGKPWREKNKKCLIEKYELIKNIPPRFLGEIDVKDFYSEIEYEF